jgi:hypothetical protein
LDTYTKNQVAMKWCYNNALKQDPGLKASRIDVTITVSSAGTVSNVSMPNQGTFLGGCLTDKIRRWKFRKSSELLILKSAILIFGRNLIKKREDHFREPLTRFLDFGLC